MWWMIVVLILVWAASLYAALYCGIHYGMQLGARQALDRLRAADREGLLRIVAKANRA